MVLDAAVAKGNFLLCKMLNYEIILVLGKDTAFLEIL